MSPARTLDALVLTRSSGSGRGGCNCTGFGMAWPKRVHSEAANSCAEGSCLSGSGGGGKGVASYAYCAAIHRSHVYLLYSLQSVHAEQVLLGCQNRPRTRACARCV